MRIKLECNSCGYAELISDRRVVYCPECGSSDVEYETDPLAESRQVEKQEPDPFPELARGASIEVDSEKSKEVEPDIVTIPESKDENKPEPEIKTIAETESGAEPEQVSKEPSRPVYNWTQRPSSRSSSGYGSGMSEGAQARAVLGIIGLIMILSAVGIFFTVGFGGLAGAVTLGVIGFIFLAIASKGELCECCAGC